MGDALDRVRLAMGENGSSMSDQVVRCAVWAPLGCDSPGSRRLMFAGAISILALSNTGAVGKFRRLHTTEQVEIFSNRASRNRAVLARSVRSAALFPHVVLAGRRHRRGLS